MPLPPDAIPVDRSELRRIFNDAHLWEKMQQGSLTACVRRHSHCDPPLPNEPHCTHSDIVVYVTPEQCEVAMVHQYTRPDGSVGASGKPDPIWVVKDGKRYYYR